MLRSVGLYMKRNKKTLWIPIIVAVCFVAIRGIGTKLPNYSQIPDIVVNNGVVTIGDSVIDEYNKDPYYKINSNIPFFSKSDYVGAAFENYGELDYLGRCTTAYAKLGTETMPTEERESIAKVHPTGWQSVKYDFVDGKNLYNRCHLIGFQLSAENANEKNLITGTRYMNVEGMLPFENMVADYIKETGNHVLYRVTPIFEGENLVALGVLMEAFSVEDNGRGICFNVYCYNVQPDIEIDYLTGSSWIADTKTDETLRLICFLLYNPKIFKCQQAVTLLRSFS